MERDQTSLPFYYLEKLGRESNGNEAWKPASEGGCLAKKPWTIVGFLSKKLSFVVIYTEIPQRCPPQSVPWERLQTSRGFPFQLFRPFFLPNPAKELHEMSRADTFVPCERRERNTGVGFWEPLAPGRCELTFPLLIIKKVSPRAPWRMMYSPLS